MLVQLIIPAEAARDTVMALGDVGLLQFKDLNPEKSAFQRTYANQVKRCDEMARKLRFFESEVHKAEILSRPNPTPEIVDIDELEAKLEELETELLEVNSNSERLTRSYSELVELQLVLEKAGAFFDEARAEGGNISTQVSNPIGPGDIVGGEMGAPLLESQGRVDMGMARLGFVAGVIPQEKVSAFERVLFRATRGNMFLKQAAVGSVVDPSSGEKMEKSVFMVFFAGENARAKILKICEAFNASRYPFPEEMTRQQQMYGEVTTRLRELHTTNEVAQRHRDNVLQGIATNLHSWSIQVKREKSVYHHLNKLSIDVTRKCLVAEAWCPIMARGRVQDALRLAAEQANAQVGTIFQPLPTSEQPPTFYLANKVQSAFQQIVEAYGIARYREANPAVFTIATFPYMFAIMFGDLGHAILMLMFAGFMVYKEKQMLKMDLNEMVDMAFGGRYVILFMALFSIFCGIIYNEAFSIPMSIFGFSHFTCAYDTPADKAAWDDGHCNLALPHTEAYHHTLVLKMPNGTAPYAFGIDPIWHGTKTELPFLNSYKMKMSIIVGVIHMNLGIFCSLYNQLFFHDRLSMYTEFIPQVLFLNCLFGYLSFLIVLKWISGSTADLYNIMIYMFLSPGSLTQENTLFTGQAGLQVVLVLVALVCVPWMLLPKPFILKKRHETAQYSGLRADSEDDHATLTVEEPPGGGHGHGEVFEFGEVMVHQMIHTIEFVLGAVSNTASYLRLWALSLAHAQLSAVFYDMLLMLPIRMGTADDASNGMSIAMIVVGFFVWACATMGVLMIMESLSAFLHALRLHWVEYQNKFYHGDGYKFVPYTFADVDKEEL